MTAKEQIIGGLQAFTHNIIDDLIVARNNVVAGFLSDKIKIAADNVISKYEDDLDEILLFITDKDGNINVLDFDDETIKAALEEMPVMNYSIRNISYSVGKGSIDLRVPDNILTNMLLGDEKIISLKYSDISSLIELINK